MKFVVIYNKKIKKFIWYTIHWFEDKTTEFGHTEDITEAQVWKERGYRNALKKYCAYYNLTKEDISIKEVPYEYYLNYHERLKEWSEDEI